MREAEGIRWRFLLHQWLDAHANATPDRQAMAFMECSLSYDELRNSANCLAHCLLSHGVKRGDRVGIYMDKCLEVPIAIYGIMKAGAAYVPLDPSAPPERISEIIEDCGIRLLMTTDGRLKRLENTHVECLRKLTFIGPTSSSSRSSWDELAENFPKTDPGVKVVPGDLAYHHLHIGFDGQAQGNNAHSRQRSQFCSLGCR